MHWESALTTAAEVGIGIAGFSGVFVAIARRNSGEWSPPQALALEVLLVASGAAIFASLLPFLLLEIGLSPSSTWAAASLVYGLWLPGIAAFRLRQTTRAGASNRSWMVLVTASVAALVLANAAWFRTSSPYMAAVYWQLFVAFHSFVFLLRGFSRPE